MGLESATYISELVTTNPVHATDDVAEGDDHLRLIKAVLQATFPNADLAFYLSEDFADVTSAGTTDIGAATSQLVNITASNTITSLGTAAAGVWRILRFAAALTFTHNATSLILPGGANITTAADDCCLAVSLGAGNWRVPFYQRANGTPLGTVPVSLGGTGQTTAAEAVGELIQANSEDTTPDRIADMAGVYDASGDTGSKVALYNLAGMAVLATGTLSGATSLDIPLDTAGYSAFKSFRLILREFVPVTDGVGLYLRASDDGGVTFEADAADYAWRRRQDELSTIENQIYAGDGSDSEIEMTGTVGNSTNEFATIEVRFDNPQGTSQPKVFHWTGYYKNTSASHFGLAGNGIFLATDDITDIQVLFSSGNISSGTWTLIGIL